MRRWLSVLLVLSLLFNAAVVVGFMSGAGRRPPLHGPPAPPPMDLARAARSLDLSDSQRAAIRALQDETHQVMSTFDEESQFLEQLLNDELAKESPSGERVRETLDRQAELVRDRRRTQADLFERFQRQLTPDQRQMLRGELDREMARRMRSDGPRPPIGRFDIDGDGRLNDEEAAAAHNAFEARRAAMGAPDLSRAPHDAPRPHDLRPPPLWPFFDHDSDGRLDDTERAERDEFLRTHPLSTARPRE